MKPIDTTANSTDYKIDESIQRKFFHNSRFCRHVKECIKNVLSLSITIIPQKLSESRTDVNEGFDGYIIHVSNTHENKPEMEQAISTFFKNLFATVQVKSFSNQQGS
jgi:hypothetical protein